MVGLSRVETSPRKITNPVEDPLGVLVPLPYDFVLYPYGVPVRFLTNSRAVAASARESWASWTKRFDVRPVEIRVVVDLDSPIEDGCPPPPVMRAQRNLLMMITGVENYACCDLSEGFASAWITRSVAADDDYLRFYFLEAMVYSILSAKYLTFIHAACVASSGQAILLAGESGAGKTSLAYACAHSGWTFLSDDASVLCHRDSDAVVLGDSRRFRFRDSAAALFPELQGLPDSRRPCLGKPTLELPTGAIGIQTAFEARARHVVFLKRHADPSRPANLLPLLDTRAAEQSLHNNVWPHELGTFDRNQRVIQRLLMNPAYELHYCRLEDAVDLLGGLFQRNCA